MGERVFAGAYGARYGKLAAALLFSTSAFVFTPAAHAQTATAADAATETGTEDVSLLSVGEIVVTAQRREQRLQDVPISISALSGADLESRNINNIENLDSFVPNLKVYTGTFNSTSTVAIRGGVEISVTPYYDPAVGTYIDGVYIAKAQGNLFNLADIERIEVLRGPQGTLYGRNTFAGAINIITSKPTGELGGNIKLGFGNFGQRKARLNLDLPAFGDFAVKLSGLIDRQEGFVPVRPNPFTNVANAQPGGPKAFEARNNKAARVAVRYDPGGGFLADYAFDYTKNRSTPRGGRLDNVATLPLSGALFDPASPSYAGGLVGGTYFGLPADLYLLPDYVDYTYGNGSVNNIPAREGTEVLGHTLTLEQDIGGASLKSISSYRTMDYQFGVDLDGTPLALAATALWHDYDQLSQELQISGKTGSLNYTAGLYYFHEKGDVKNRGQFFGQATTSYNDYSFSTDAYAAYAQADLEVLPQLTLTAGLRYSYEKKKIQAVLSSLNEASGVFTPIFPTATVTGRDSRTDGSLTPTAIVKYDFSRDANVYLKYARGFKSGGFNIGTSAPFAITTYDPQNADSYEAGTKLRFLDGAVQFNSAVFFSKISDQQVTVFRNDGLLAASVVDNAAQGEVWGVESDFQILPNDRIRLSGSVGYLQSKYKDYFDQGVDVSKTRATIFAPEWTIAGSAEIALAKSDRGNLLFNVDYSYTSSFFVQAFDVRPRSATVRSSAQSTKAAALSLVDASLRATELEGLGGNVEISLWMKNVFNVHKRAGGIDFGPSFGNLTVAYYNPPRTFGADALFRF